jgi:uncharacterized protein YcnI
VLKRGGAILLKNKMPDPRKAIAQDRKKNQNSGIAGKKEKKQKRDNGPGPHKMEFPAHEIGVLTQIKGIKVSKALKFH